MKRTLLFRLTLLLVIFASPAGPALAATQSLCAGSAVPNGWIKIDHWTSATQCKPSIYQYNVWTIESYYDKPERYTMTVCWNPATPSGWITTDKFSSATRCYESTVMYNNKSIYRVALADTQLNMCHDSPIPSGWIQTDDLWSSTKCSAPSVAYNVWIISRYNNKPVGSTMVVCSDAITPSGWNVISTNWSATRCKHTSGNIKTIKRVS